MMKRAQRYRSLSMWGAGQVRWSRHKYTGVRRYYSTHVRYGFLATAGRRSFAGRALSGLRFPQPYNTNDAVLVLAA